MNSARRFCRGLFSLLALVTTVDVFVGGTVHPALEIIGSNLKIGLSEAELSSGWIAMIDLCRFEVLEE